MGCYCTDGAIWDVLVKKCICGIGAKWEKAN